MRDSSQIINLFLALITRDANSSTSADLCWNSPSGWESTFSNNLSFKPLHVLISKSLLKCHSKPHVFCGTWGPAVNFPTTKQHLWVFFFWLQVLSFAHKDARQVIHLGMWSFSCPPVLPSSSHPLVLFLVSLFWVPSTQTGLGRPGWYELIFTEREGRRQEKGDQNAR